MTVTAFKKCKIVLPKHNRSKTYRQFIFVFENSHALLEGVLFLYRNTATKNIKSALYSYKTYFYLVIYSRSEKPGFLHLKEYCTDFLSIPFSVEYLKEYGKLLIDSNAVKVLGQTFFKEI